MARSPRHVERVRRAAYAVQNRTVRHCATRADFGTSNACAVRHERPQNRAVRHCAWRDVGAVRAVVCRGVGLDFVLRIGRFQIEPFARVLRFRLARASTSFGLNHFAAKIHESAARVARGHGCAVGPLYRDLVRTYHDPIDHRGNDCASLIWLHVRPSCRDFLDPLPRAISIFDRVVRLLDRRSPFFDCK
jgi:hypothetical protein